jgi:hypothetical protein
MANPAASSTSTPASETESDALTALFDVLSVLEDQKLSYQLAGSGIEDSLNLAMYQLKGVAPATTSSEATTAYPWANIPRDQLVTRIADMALEAITLIESKEEDA